tara:strand:- start:1006 stop:1131 length:126 start_codon:yes stop_codon:yes gene_type:complete
MLELISYYLVLAIILFLGVGGYVMPLYFVYINFNNNKRGKK